MLQPNAYVIQIEIGSAVIKAFTRRDNRDFIDKFLWGESAPKEGELLPVLIRRLRNDLKQSEGLDVPTISHVVNNQLEPAQVLACFGIEMFLFKIENIEQLLNFIAQKIREYNSVPTDKDSINELLLSCIEDIKKGNYQSAFKKCSIGYYHSHLQKYEFELIRCLSDGGGILLKNGDLMRAFGLYSLAVSLCNNPAIVDPIIKIQVNINAATTFKILQKLDMAFNCYMQAARIAFYSGNYTLLFISLIGVAEIQYAIGNYDQTIVILKQADALLFSEEKEPDYQAMEASRSIHKYISQIQDII
jgi:tetratricopeptide (TPR) repeat protein